MLSSLGREFQIQGSATEKALYWIPTNLASLTIRLQNRSLSQECKGCVEICMGRWFFR